MGCTQRGHRAAGAGAELLMRLTFMTGLDFNANSKRCVTTARNRMASGARRLGDERRQILVRGELTNEEEGTG